MTASELMMAESCTDESVINFVDKIITEAYEKSVSDIHIEPFEPFCRLRYRIDGMLTEIEKIPNFFAERIIMRIKIMADLDIAEKRLPQDGRILSLHNLDIRVSVYPVFYGEKIVLRLLDTKKMLLALDELGMNTEQASLFKQKLSQPQGLILVTGPTGSGKTLTLYSALQWLNTIERNILTVEDPVEVRLTGINQTAIAPKIGLNYATALRAILRQDPDVVMIGEIRDSETAKIALEAAQTGHLVLSTLHTRNAYESLWRLIALGCSKTLLAHTLSLALSQRLARKICLICKQHYSNCEHCNNGYSGRIGIFECLPLDACSTHTLDLKNLRAEENAFIGAKQASLYQAGLDKVSSGETTLHEIQRILSI
jgi:type IV pilus assembly protein PilB